MTAVPIMEDSFPLPPHRKSTPAGSILPQVCACDLISFQNKARNQVVLTPTHRRENGASGGLSSSPRAETQPEQDPQAPDCQPPATSSCHHQLQPAFPQPSLRVSPSKPASSAAASVHTGWRTSVRGSPLHRSQGPRRPSGAQGHLPSASSPVCSAHSGHTATVQCSGLHLLSPGLHTSYFLSL